MTDKMRSHAGSKTKHRHRAELEIRRLCVRVPGSTANLGPGFDSLALALNRYCTLTFDLLEENDLSVPLITLKGVLVKGLPKDQSNLIYRVLSNFWRSDPDILQRVRITIESEVPLGKGLGSSAAAIIGSVWAACALTQDLPDTAGLLEYATQIENHPDNVSACLLGGLVVSGNGTDGKIITQKLTWPSEWCTIVIVPPYVLSTKKARSVLPKTIKYEDAVHNVQRVSLLLAAVTTKNEEVMREALDDRMHEPYRLKLVPELKELRDLLSDQPILGCVLSGAGSSVLVIAHRRHRKAIVDRLNAWAKGKKASPEILDLQVDQEGIKVSYE